MQNTLDFKVDPIRFILEERIEFLHKFKNFANTLGVIRELEDPSKSSLVPGLITNVGNYRLPLATFQGKMPDSTSEAFLTNLVLYMNLLWTERNQLDIDRASYISDRILDMYERLGDYLQDSQEALPSK